MEITISFYRNYGATQKANENDTKMQDLINKAKRRQKCVRFQSQHCLLLYTVFGFVDYDSEFKLVESYLSGCFCTLQEDQTIRTFEIFQKFLTLKLVLWAMEKCTFSTIQPISEIDFMCDTK